MEKQLFSKNSNAVETRVFYVNSSETSKYTKPDLLLKTLRRYWENEHCKSSIRED